MNIKNYYRKMAGGLLAMALISASPSRAALRVDNWDEVVGKKIVNLRGDVLGYVEDTAIDVEHGRYVGMLVSSGGILGVGAKIHVVPPGAFEDRGTPRTLYLDMSKEQFANAPTFKMSEEVGPPATAHVAAVYEYYGQQPYFSRAGEGGEPLGFIKEGSKVILMPVENLQGKKLGTVAGLRKLNHVTGKLEGVVIMPNTTAIFDPEKVVPPQALRYNLKHDRLRLNDDDQPFAATSTFAFIPGGKVMEEPATHADIPPAPLPQSSNDRDKNTTKEITKAILATPDISHFAKNVEVGTVQGKTTLRGRVENKAEHDRILASTMQIAGPGNVTDLLYVKPMTSEEQQIDESTTRTTSL